MNLSFPLLHGFLLTYAVSFTCLAARVILSCEPLKNTILLIFYLISKKILKNNLTNTINRVYNTCTVVRISI